MFGLWLADNGHSHEVDVQADARNVAKVFQKSDGNCRAELCETVDKLSDILNTDNFQKLMKKFGEKCGCKSKCRTVRCCHTLAGHINRIRNACKLQKLQMLSLYLSMNM